jgi:hypothetical protein
MRAFLAGQQAHAAAQSGDRTQALVKLREAETAMDRAESQAKALGSYDPSSMQYHVAQVRYELGDRAESITAMEESDVCDTKSTGAGASDIWGRWPSASSK